MGTSGGGGGAAQGAMQDALKNQGLAANNINTSINSLSSQATMLNSPLQTTTNTLSGGINALSPGYQSGLGTALSSGGNLSAQTGVNQNQLGKSLVDYASAPGKTNLSGVNPGLSSFYQGEMNSQAPQGLNSFYQGEMSQGMGQPAMLNAQNQLQQQFAIANNTAKANAAPGTNQAATDQASKNSLLTASGNLAGTLAGENQQIKQQGATGIANTQQNQQQTQQQGATGLSNTASGLDSQVMNMLQQAFSTGQGLNTQSLQNLMSVLGLGTTTLNQGLGAAQQGAANTGAGISANEGLFSGYGGQAQQFGAQAAENQKSGGLGSVLGPLVGMGAAAMTGGAAGAGGLGAILGGI
jgi:hypothetical protein